MLHFRRALLACAVLAATALAACGTDAYPGEPPGALHTYVISEMKGFDPIQAGEETSSLLVINFFDQLYEFDYLARPFALTGKRHFVLSWGAPVEEPLAPLCDRNRHRHSPPRSHWSRSRAAGPFLCA